MDVEEFISEALRQIIAGVQKAQAGDSGDNVNAATAGTSVPFGGNIIHTGASGIYTRVDFDIAVSGETNAKAGANLKVFGVGVEGGGDSKHGTANRISFSVPVRLPDGDPTRAAAAKSATSARQDQMLSKLRNSRRSAPL